MVVVADISGAEDWKRRHNFLEHGIVEETLICYTYLLVHAGSHS